MGDPPHWARTQDEINVLLDARKYGGVCAACSYGGVCAACGRELDRGETVCIEQFATMPRRGWPVMRQPQKSGPVCGRCASADALAYAVAEEPEPRGPRATGAVSWTRRPPKMGMGQATDEHAGAVRYRAPLG